MLTEDGDIAAAAGTSGTRDGQHAGVDGADGSGGTVDGVVGRGLWDEAAAGDVSALAAALSEGGGGDIHACNADGEIKGVCVAGMHVHVGDWELERVLGREACIQRQ